MHLLLIHDRLTDVSRDTYSHHFSPIENHPKHCGSFLYRRLDLQSRVRRHAKLRCNEVPALRKRYSQHPAILVDG